MRAMTSYPKSFTFTPAVGEFEEIEWREPIDLDAVSQLIGATNDFRAAARSYLDALEGTAIFSLAFRELDREALELSSNVIRPLFDELADTFVEPYRETNPALAQRGRQMLLALLKAASIIGAPHGAIAPERETDVRDNSTRPAQRVRKLHDEYANAKLTDAVAKAVGPGNTPPPMSDRYVRSIEPAVRDELKLADPKMIRKPAGWPGISTLKEEVRKIAEQRKGQHG
jgi:hypothetical protein